VRHCVACNTRFSNVVIFIVIVVTVCITNRTLPFREDLLRGMLNADQIGFHLYEYARHFLTCCRRILGLNEGAEVRVRRSRYSPVTHLELQRTEITYTHSRFNVARFALQKTI
jgi:trehalose-6-phosphate synthase